MTKTLPKIFITIFLFIFLFQLAGLIFLLAVPEASYAGDKKDPVYFTPQVGVGDFAKGEKKLVGDSTEMIGKYIREIYKYAIGIVGILAAVVLMFGGVLWLTAGGNAERVTNAKSWIGASLTGLVLALCSYMILAMINPGLVNFRVTPVTPVVDKGNSGDKKGCCEYSTCSTYITQAECKKKNKYVNWMEGLYYTCDGNDKCKAIMGCCFVRKTDTKSICIKNCEGNNCETEAKAIDGYKTHGFYANKVSCMGIVEVSCDEYQ